MAFDLTSIRAKERVKGTRSVSPRTLLRGRRRLSWMSQLL